jgi:beta-ureidopropionase
VPEKGNLPGNYRRLMSVLAEIQSHAADIVVTPECFLDGYVSTEDWVTAENIVEYAIDPQESRFVRGVSEWARSNSAWFIFGCSRSSPEGVYNSALILDRTGRLAGAYDKTHCQTHDRKYVPGRRLAAYESDFGPFCVMICADRRWPETVRTLALQGARVIFNPTYGMDDELNLRMMQTRSYESEVFIAFTHPQQSLVTGPYGQIVCDVTDDSVTYAVCDLDLSDVDAIRAGESSHLKDRRPDLY